MSAIVIIPSRYQSTRFPGKPLSLLKNKPMVQHVYERSKAARLVDDVFVATDSKEIFDAVHNFGGKALMTSETHASGTDRIAEAANMISSEGYPVDIIVNVQGDEPMIKPQMIDQVISLMEDARADIGTLVKRIEDDSEISDPNVVKAVFNSEGFALYFSRSPIPYHRELFGSRGMKSLGNRNTELRMFKHIGIYTFRKKALAMFTSLAPSRLEELEKLEQLRALENAMTIKVGETLYETVGVDTPMDLTKVEKCLSISS
ncbi:MAG TPA: 3-deoxy-manno-octulosonate cytidylyltransferase [Dissulfurispiraceae bacterium]|nr:3-deoxy-manno-octulosonate cytidylyltransferase [Dissulfurispiraceae bacterium]